MLLSKPLSAMAWTLVIVRMNPTIMQTTCLEFKELDNHADFIPYSAHSLNLIGTLQQNVAMQVATFFSVFARTVQFV